MPLEKELVLQTSRYCQFTSCRQCPSRYGHFNSYKKVAGSITILHSQNERIGPVRGALDSGRIPT